jgi:hypothetical protein
MPDPDAAEQRTLVFERETRRNDAIERTRNPIARRVVVRESGAGEREVGVDRQPRLKPR